MESIIAKLLDDFEHGRMTRRQLIKSIAVVATAAAVPRPASAESAKGFRAVRSTTSPTRSTTTRRPGTSTRICWE